MKTIIHKILPLGFGVLGALPALAIEPPKDDAPPPPSVKTPASTRTDDRSSRIEIPAKNNDAFIGLITAELPDMLAAHLETKPGEGVVVRDLAPGGPAEKAGFSRFDVITRVGGEPVGSPTQLSERIASRKPGDEISVDLIHEGKSTVKTVVLGTRPASAGRSESPSQMGGIDPGELQEGRADRLREMIERRLNGMMREPQEMPDLRQDARGNFKFKSDATFRLMDNEGSVEMKSTDGSKEITVRDHHNNVTWTGPWTTEKDKAAAPPGVRERIERFKFDEGGINGGGFRFRMSPQGPKEEE